MQNSLIERIKLNKSALQIIAIITMFIDHLAIFAPVPAVYYIMRFIGRATIIIMCYFVAEGYYKTQNLGKYIIRMAVFAAISQIPYYLYANFFTLPQSTHAILFGVFKQRNVIFTLFVGLCLLTVLLSEYKLIIKMLAILAALRLVKSSNGGYWAVLWIVGFGIFHGSMKKQMIWLASILALRIVLMAIDPVIGIIQTNKLLYRDLYDWLEQFGGFIAMLLIPLYNGERGKLNKWVLYIFYPLHLTIIIGVLALIIFK